MAWNYVIDKDKKLVVTTATEIVTAADFEEHQNRLINDPDFDSSFSQLADLSEVTQLELDSGTIARLSHRNMFSPLSRRAFVVADSLGHGLIRMFSTYRDINGGGENIQIFRDRNQALRWLGQETGD
jgi:hypothetical protein